MEARASIVLNVEWVQCNLSCKIVKNRRIRNGNRTEWSPIWSVIITITKFSNLIGYQLPWFQFWFKKEPYISQTVLKLWLIGNRTSCRQIRSVIILVIKQIGLPLRGRPILLLARMITDQIGLHSVLLPLLLIRAIGRHEVLLPINHNFKKIVIYKGFFKIKTQEIPRFFC